MAYITTDQVKEKRNLIKKAFPAKDGWKFSITREHFSSLQIHIMQYPDNYDFGTEHAQINHFHYDSDDDFGDAEKAVIKKLNDIAHLGHWDDSDIMTDYFNCAFYVNLAIGKWDRMPVSVPAKGKKEVSVHVKLNDYYKNLVKNGTDVADVLKMMYS